MKYIFGSLLLLSPLFSLRASDDAMQLAMKKEVAGLMESVHPVDALGLALNSLEDTVKSLVDFEKQSTINPVISNTGSVVKTVPVNVNSFQAFVEFTKNNKTLTATASILGLYTLYKIYQRVTFSYKKPIQAVAVNQNVINKQPRQRSQGHRRC